MQSQQQNLVVPSPNTLLSNGNKINPSNQTSQPNQPQSNNANTQQINRTSSQHGLNAQIQPRVQSSHHPHLLQNCTNLIQSSPLNGQNAQSNSIWGHPGIQQQMPHGEKNIVPHDDLLHANNENIRHHPHHHFHPNEIHQLPSHNLHQQLSPDSSPNSNQLWSLYNNNNSATANSNLNAVSKCVIGLNQLKLIEFSGFVEKRRDPEIVNFCLIKLNKIFFNFCFSSIISTFFFI